MPLDPEKLGLKFDGAHERLYAVHGVRLGPAARAAILEQGFLAWG